MSEPSADYLRLSRPTRRFEHCARTSSSVFPRRRDGPAEGDMILVTVGTTLRFDQSLGHVCGMLLNFNRRPLL